MLHQYRFHRIRFGITIGLEIGLLTKITVWCLLKVPFKNGYSGENCVKKFSGEVGINCHQSSPILTLGAVEIPFTERTRHLGVVLTSSLKWTDHVQSLIRKQSFHVFVLKRLAQRRNSAAIAKRLFVGLVRPALEYASPVWDGCPKRDCVALERIQLAVARAVLHCSRRDVSNTETLRRTGWPTLA